CYYNHQLHIAYHFFPTRRSSDLPTPPVHPPAVERLHPWKIEHIVVESLHDDPRAFHFEASRRWTEEHDTAHLLFLHDARRSKAQDRKSTRLNSSHDSISYSVFCL